MRVLVAGGAGFIGSHVCDELLRRGHEVVCLDNLVSGRMENIAEIEHHPRFGFVREDVTRTPTIETDLILHLASPASPVHYQRFAIETMLANSAGTHRLLALAADTGARFVFASTSEVYGDPLVHPQTEDVLGQRQPARAAGLLRRIEAVRRGDHVGVPTQARRQRDDRADLQHVRPAHERERRPRRAGVGRGRAAGEPLPIAGDGRQTRSFCYVSDLVEALLLVALDGGATARCSTSATRTRSACWSWPGGWRGRRVTTAD